MCVLLQRESLGQGKSQLGGATHSASIPTNLSLKASKQPSTASLWPSNDASPHPTFPSESVIFTNNHLGGTRKYSISVTGAILVNLGLPALGNGKSVRVIRLEMTD